MDLLQLYSVRWTKMYLGLLTKVDSVLNCGNLAKKSITNVAVLGKHCSNLGVVHVVNVFEVHRFMRESRGEPDLCSFLCANISGTSVL